MIDPRIRLRNSIINGKLIIVKRLLRRYPELLENIDSSNGWSSLHYASFHGQYLICLFLISLGHDKDEIHVTFKDNTCVHLAILNNYHQTLHLLLQQNPKFKSKYLNFKNKDFETPLHFASRVGAVECLDLLLDLGANINALDINGNTALHLATRYGNINCIKSLLLYGSDFDMKNVDDWLPVQLA
ncbi:ankyrin repeat domain-containing protein, partial [Ascoidea rubescens DSM 1968]